MVTASAPTTVMATAASAEVAASTTTEVIAAPAEVTASSTAAWSAKVGLAEVRLAEALAAAKTGMVAAEDG